VCCVPCAVLCSVCWVMCDVLVITFVFIAR
jgi:hypothetical protein